MPMFHYSFTFGSLTKVQLVIARAIAAFHLSQTMIIVQVTCHCCYRLIVFFVVLFSEYA